MNLTQRQLFLKHVAQTSDFPLMLEIEKAEGVYLYDSAGKRYIDLISGIGVSNVGHRHPAVIKAIEAQLDKYLHLMVYGEFVQSPQVQLAKALSETLPAGLEYSYFVNSGSEATEGALKLAKRYTGRSEIISFHNAYHGSSHGSLSVCGSETFKQAYRPLLPGIKFISYNQAQELEIISNQTAAVIIEPVQGEGGVRIPDKKYMQELSARCKEKGALLIVDEIQTGYGRTGTFWCFEKFDIVPDIILTAKGMGGGMPIGAFISTKEIMSVLKNDPILGHITTFGGHPVSCAAALATLQVIKSENLQESVNEKANLFKKMLIHTRIRQIRNSGLLMAVEFESFEILKFVIDESINNGILTDWFLYCDNSMRIAPPLIITKSEIEEACSIITQVINKL